MQSSKALLQDRHTAAINAWRDRGRRQQKEISPEHLTEEKSYPLGTTDEYFESPYEDYPITYAVRRLSSLMET